MHICTNLTDTTVNYFQIAVTQDFESLREANAQIHRFSATDESSQN
jgi:hypothetical protein